MGFEKRLKDIVTQMLTPIRTRIQMVVSRGVLELLKDGGGLQVVKLDLLAGENRDNIERFQQYGFSSAPFPGAEAVVVFPGGNREHGLCIAIDDRKFRFKSLANGEVVLYTDEGDKIHFKRDNVIDVDCNTLELGNGTLEKILNGETFQSRFNAHTHLGNAGVPTGAPIIPSPVSDLSTVVKGGGA